MEYHSTIKRNEILIHATTWVTPENIMLSERSQSPKSHLLYNIIYIKCSKQANLERQKADEWSPGARGSVDEE